MIRLLAHSLPPLFLSKLSLLFSVFLCVAGKAKWGRGEEVGEEPNYFLKLFIVKQVPNHNKMNNWNTINKNDKICYTYHIDNYISKQLNQDADPQ